MLKVLMATPIFLPNCPHGQMCRVTHSATNPWLMVAAVMSFRGSQILRRRRTRSGRKSAGRSTSSAVPTRQKRIQFQDPRAVRTKMGRTEVATQILPSRDAFANFSCCSLMTLWTPTLSMARMEVAAERMLVGVQIPDTRKCVPPE